MLILNPEQLVHVPKQALICVKFLLYTIVAGLGNGFWILALVCNEWVFESLKFIFEAI